MFPVLAAVSVLIYMIFCDLQNVGTSHGRIRVKSLSYVLANTVSDINMLICVQKYLTL